MAHSSCWKVSKVLFIKKKNTFFFLKLVSVIHGSKDVLFRR